jgi:adenylosuccinate synthase
MDKMNRTGLRVQDMLDEHIFREKLAAALEYTNPILEKVYEMPTYTVEQVCETYLPYADRIRPHIVESSRFLNDALPLFFCGHPDLKVSHASAPPLSFAVHKP